MEFESPWGCQCSCRSVVRTTDSQSVNWGSIPRKSAMANEITQTIDEDGFAHLTFADNEGHLLDVYTGPEGGIVAWIDGHYVVIDRTNAELLSWFIQNMVTPTLPDDEPEIGT